MTGQQCASLTCTAHGERNRLRASLEAMTADRDLWKKRRDNAVELCRFRHQEGLTAAEWHARICGATSREWAVAFLEEWVKPYFGDDSADAVAAVQRAAVATFARFVSPPGATDEAGPC